MARICRALDETDAPQALFDLATRLGLPTSLRALGVQHTELGRVTDAALSAPYPNPRPLDRQEIRRLLERAYWGIPPHAELAQHELPGRTV